MIRLESISISLVIMLLTLLELITIQSIVITLI
nr:MAG TPA: hypothetical protein [Caudoviricetes sp.]